MEARLIPDKVAYFMQKAIESFLGSEDIYMNIPCPNGNAQEVLEIISGMRLPIVVSKEERDDRVSLITIERIQH